MCLLMMPKSKEGKYMENKKIELLKPKYDVVFQALFGENRENITESFLSDILGEKVKIIDIKTDEAIAREFPDEKTGRLDLKTKFEDRTICQVEMQMADEKNTVKRILYYWARSYAKQLKRGEKYSDLKKTIGIIITNYTIKQLEEIEELDTKWQIIETKRGKRLLTDDLELRIIEIPKAEKVLEKEKYNRIAQWLLFLDNPNTERVEEIMKENEEVKKAGSVLHVMSEDEKLQRLAELREKWELDERSALSSAREDGIEEEKFKIAKRMKEKGMTIEEIEELTELTKQEIEEL